MKKKSRRTVTQTKKKETKDNRLIKLENRIKELRKKQGYTSYDLFAFDSQLNRSQIGRYENGDDMYYHSLLKD